MIVAQEKNNKTVFLQCLFKTWLAEKEEALNEVQTSNFKNSSEFDSNVRRLAVSTHLVLFSHCSFLIYLVC